MKEAESAAPDMRQVYLPEVVGGGYRDFWHFRGRYRVVKGSRASKKSKTTALNLIWQMLRYPGSNALVVRRTYRSLRDSCFAELKWAAARLGVAEDWQMRENPLEMTYVPTGQKIYFRGLDDPLKVASIVAHSGWLCFMWIEEAYELEREADFDALDESIRGDLPEGLFKQVTLTFNPWHEGHWLKRRFFDRAGDDPDVLVKTVDHRCNEFLDEADRRMFARMAEQDPRRYRVAGLGEWGVSEGLVYERWREAEFVPQEVAARPEVRSVFGLDFGYVNDETALFCGLVDMAERRLYVFDEVYQRGMSNERIYQEIYRRGYAKERIRADCAEPKSIDRLRELGLTRICAARKGRDSILHGIDLVRGFEILVLPQCRNFLAEIGGYCWQQDAAGRALNRPVDERNHLMDAMRYAMEGVLDGEVYSFE